MLLAGACGDDSDGGDGVSLPGAGDDIEEATEGAGSDDTDIDPCTLLEVEEIEAEFGDAGPVTDGEPEFDQCNWLVGEDQSQLGTGSVHVFVQYVDPDLPVEDASEIFAAQKDETDSAVEIDGLGDDAYFHPDLTTVHFLMGDRMLFVQAVFIPERPDVQESLERLAHLVADRI